MTIIPEHRKRGLFSHGLPWFISFCFLFTALPLFGEATPMKIGSASLTLPAGWIVSEVCKDATLPEHVSSSTEPNAMTLLMAARPADTSRKAGISLFRTNFQTMGPPPLTSGETGVNAEAERLLCMVLGLGFTPSALQTTRSTSSQHTSLLTVEVTAKNASGEERVFTDTVAGSTSPTTRLFTSRMGYDQAAALEINAMIKSMGAFDDKNRASQGAQNSGTTASSSPNPTPEAAPNNPITAQSGQIVSDYSEALLMVEGQKGKGSGFICKMGDRTYAFTNAHVISSNPGFTLNSFKTPIKVQNGAVAVGHDIVRMEVTNAPKSFELMENIDAAVKIGDIVTVLGNAEGARVVRPVEGKIVGLGPDLVEVDAAFVPGNSGSPIVHMQTGKVLGIATYLIEHKMKKDGSRHVVAETRRFGYRIDSVKTWEPINWQVFYAQGAQLEKIVTLSNDFIRLFNKEDHVYSVSDYKSSAMQNAVKNLETGQKYQYGGSTLLKQFLTDLRMISRADLGGFDQRTAYDYFRREFAEQSEFRNAVYDALWRDSESSSF